MKLKNLNDKKGLEWWHFLIILAIGFFLLKYLPSQAEENNGSDMIKAHFYDANGNEIFPTGGQTFATITGVGSMIEGVSFEINVQNTGEAQLANVQLAHATTPATPAPFETALSGKVNTYTLNGLVDSQPGTGQTGQWISNIIPLASNPGLFAAPNPTSFCVTVLGDFYSGGDWVTMSKTGCLDLVIGADVCVSGTPFNTCVNDMGLYCQGSTTGGTEVQSEACCTNSLYLWNSGSSTCEEITCTDGTLHDQCSTTSYGKYCTSSGSLIWDCNTCGQCNMILDGEGNPYTCNAGTSECEPITVEGNFLVGVGTGTTGGTGVCVTDVDCTPVTQECNTATHTCENKIVVLRTNSGLDGNYQSDTIAIDRDDSGVMEYYGFTSDTCTNTHATTETEYAYDTPDGHDVHWKLVSGSNYAYIYSTAHPGCTGYTYTKYTMKENTGTAIPTTQTPTEPYASAGQEVYQ